MTIIPPELRLHKTGSCPVETLSMVEFMAKAGSLGRKGASAWVASGLVLSYGTAAGTMHHLDRDYVEALIRHGGRMSLDRRFLELFCLCWHTRNSAPEEAALARSLLEQGMAQGWLIDTDSARRQLGIFSAKGVDYWRRKGYVRYAIFSNGGYPLQSRALYLALDVDRLAADENRLTSIEVMERLGIGKDALFGMVRTGALTPSRLRGHAFRFLEEEVNAHLAAREAVASRFTLTAEAAASRLGATAKILHEWRVAGVVSAGLLSRRWYFDSGEIEALRLELTTINPGFEWLQQDHDTCRREGPDWMSSKQVGAQLNLSLNSTSIWLQAGLLPFYRRTPQRLRLIRYDIPTAYIDDLLGYLDGASASRPAARAYRSECQEREQIV